MDKSGTGFQPVQARNNNFKSEASLAQYLKLKPPKQGGKLESKDGQLVVPCHPIIPFIKGDGTGPDIWGTAVPVFEAAMTFSRGGSDGKTWENT